MTCSSSFCLQVNDSAEVQPQSYLPTESGNFTLPHAGSQDYVATGIILKGKIK